MVNGVGNIVTVNAGSSSVKLAVFARNQALVPLYEVSVEAIGQPVSIVQISGPSMPTQTEEMSIPDHTAATSVIMQKLAVSPSANTIEATGHRFVHGGNKYTQPVRIQDIPAADWDFLSLLDPIHMPLARRIADTFLEQYPSALHVGCFDTAFFHDLPPVANVVPIPKKYYEAGVRRYGFHGLSYMSLLETFQEKAGLNAVNGRIIMAHLGSGASVSAVHFGKPVETTMGFTPVSGIPMSTRSGDLDPMLFAYLQRQGQLNIDDFEHMVSSESGLLGMSNITGDMRTLLDMESANPDAALAVKVFVHNVKKSIGALCAVLGGVDSLIFSGGIGEQSAVLRGRICAGLEYAGIAIDESANNQHAFLISNQQSTAGVHVIATNEARVIARQMIELMHSASEV